MYMSLRIDRDEYEISQAEERITLKNVQRFDRTNVAFHKSTFLDVFRTRCWVESWIREYMLAHILSIDPGGWGYNLRVLRSIVDTEADRARSVPDSGSTVTAMTILNGDDHLRVRAGLP
jgi:hypothetical protein